MAHFTLKDICTDNQVTLSSIKLSDVPNIIKLIFNVVILQGLSFCSCHMLMVVNVSAVHRSPVSQKFL